MSGTRTGRPATSFDDTLAPTIGPAGEAFATAFRGYDRDEVDGTLAALTSHQRRVDQRLAELDEQHRETLAETAAGAERIAQLEAEIRIERARAAKAESHLRGRNGDAGEGSGLGEDDRPRFEDVLRVAEEQASAVIKNASVQGERLLRAANEEIAKRMADARAEAEVIVSRAHHEAQQTRLRIDTETAAHEALLEQQAAHAADTVAQADQEAATIRTDAGRGAAALRALVTRETDQQRAQAEEAVRELRLKALDLDESLTRRQDDAQQEFLLLHNQAVAHAERITQDANHQVAASLEHARRVSERAADFDRGVRAQAAQIEAEAHARADETVERARTKAQRMIDAVSDHSQSVVRDAEDRLRVLHWQSQQLSTFLSDIREVIRPDGLADFADPAEEPRPVADGDAEDAVGERRDAPPSDLDESTEGVDPGAAGDQVDSSGDESGATGDQDDSSGDEHGATGEQGVWTGDDSGAPGDQEGSSGDEHGATGEQGVWTGDDSSGAGGQDDSPGDQHGAEGSIEDSGVTDAEQVTNHTEEDTR